MNARDGERPTSESRDAEHLASGAGIVLAGKGLGKIFYLATQVVLARMLGPTGFGLYAIGWTVMRVAGVILPLGLDQGVIRFATFFRSRDAAAFRGVVVLATSLAAASGAAAALGLGWGAPAVAQAIFGKSELAGVLRGFALALPFLLLLRVAAAATRVSRRMGTSVATEDLGQPLIQLALIALLAAGGLSLADAVFAATLSIVAAALLVVVGLPRLFPELRRWRPVRWPLGELVRFSLPAVSAGSFGMFILWADRFFVGALLPARYAGIYQAASQLAIVFAVVLGAFHTIFAPLAADLHHRGEIVRLRALYRTATRWGLYATGPLFAALLAAPGFWLETLFGSSYRSGALVLSVLVGGQLVNVATGSIALLLVLSGSERLWMGISAAALAVNLTLNAILVPRLGILGAAVATVAALTGLFGFGALAARRRLGAWPLGKESAVIAAAVALALVAARAVARASFQTWWLEASTILAVALLVFALVVLARGIPRQDRELATAVWGRLRGHADPVPGKP